MSKQLTDIIKPMSECSFEEVLERVRQMRRQKYIAKPATKRRVAKSNKRKFDLEKKKMQQLASMLTKEELDKLMGEL